MSENKDIHEVAGGWITERKGTPIPAFLKLAYVGFSLFGLVYLYLYWSGEVTHETRGPLVQAQNQIMQTPGTAWHAVIYACVAAFVVLLAWYAFFRRSEDE
ncbi:MAG TPA: hypothetical protein VMT70_10685 [Vicinamibacteria bacterium]|nr:hypothetical protein [Vicinamibacteria bacterium]